ncbi:hypothetical protein HK098_007148 [Nowakowskiella sp. JEL0407]|nr:hypothetical protein HK098_007148 [Nowakowskiella sp. JEL0407]
MFPPPGSIMYLTPHSVGNITRVSVGYRHQVDVDANGQTHLEDYQVGTSKGMWDTLMHLARLTRDKKLKYVVKPNPAVFHVTKRKFHNVLQGVAPKSVHLEDQDKSLWETWTEENVERYWKEGPFQVCDVAIIDDPQPSGIIPYLKQVNPDCKIIYRNHIEIRSDLVSDPTSEVHHVWNYLWEKGIKHADLFISHPVENFTPANVPDEKVVLMPAVSDPLDGLNKELSPIDIEYYWTLFNRQAFDQIGRRVDFWNRPYFIQISRFDPSKGIGEVIKAYARFRRAVHSEMVLAQVPQLVICGHGSIDDPDGTVIFEEVLAMLQGEVHLGISGEEKFVRPTCSESELGHIQDEEDISLESIAADIIVVTLQLSIREGFEIKVTEALAKGVPVIAYNSGGIPHQIHHGRTGSLVNSSLSCHTRTSQVARYMRQLILDTSLYDRMSRTAQESVDEEYFTVFNAVNWLFAANAVVDGSLPVNSDRAEEVKCIVKDAQVKLFEELGVPESVVGVLMGGEMGKGSKFDVTEGGGMEWGNEPHGKCRYLTERDVIEYQARNRALSGEKYLLVKDLWQTEYLGVVGSE